MQLSEIFTAKRYGLYNWGSVIILFWNVIKKRSQKSTNKKSCCKRSSSWHNGLWVSRIPWFEQNQLCQGWTLKKQEDGRVLPIFQLEINDPTEAETLISENLVCNVTGIVYKMEEFRQPISVSQCFNCQNFGKKL